MENKHSNDDKNQSQKLVDAVCSNVIRPPRPAPKSGAERQRQYKLRKQQKNDNGDESAKKARAEYRRQYRLKKKLAAQINTDFAEIILRQEAGPSEHPAPVVTASSMQLSPDAGHVIIQHKAEPETYTQEIRNAKKRSHNQIQEEEKYPLSTILTYTNVDASNPAYTTKCKQEIELPLEGHVNVDTVCRTCLQKFDKDIASSSITNSYYPIFQTTNLAKKLTACTSLKIEQTDKYPKNLCHSCFVKVNEFYQFQSLCVESMQQFCQIYLGSDNNTTFDTTVTQVKNELLSDDDTFESDVQLESIEDTNAGTQCSIEYSDNDGLLQPLHLETFDEEENKERKNTYSKIGKDGAIQRTLENKMDELLKRQTEIVKIVAENNFLLRHNCEMSSVSSPIKFPLEAEDKLQELETRLMGENKAEMIGILRRLTGGQIKGIDAIFGKQIIMEYNYNGEKGKKSLKSFNNCLDALYEATYGEGRSFDDFINILRQQLKKVKNRFNKQKSRMNSH
ncbi:uncharacterized protein LOC129242444 isoform X2 [Anastrepha obliqua]|uniref:uncharacterized protein LOC129242444 isoform X2 n=1 Tax=Anastrepha obliqua TaxID=95512 RepID=UPI002409D392|nr:uncharacterized protein LOC129242444 isoform X2 [Anastrepha obliqua]